MVFCAHVLFRYRGSREKMEMAPMAKHADDLEDDTIFDMGKSDVV